MFCSKSEQTPLLFLFVLGGSRDIFIPRIELAAFLSCSLAELVCSVDADDNIDDEALVAGAGIVLSTENACIIMSEITVSHMYKLRTQR